MNSVLLVYDVPSSLKIANPSPVLRRWGVRVNLSAWIIPTHLVPTEYLDELRDKGVRMHLVEFAEKEQAKIIEFAREELKRHARQIVNVVAEKCSHIREVIDTPASALFGVSEELEDRANEEFYRKWRSVIARGKRELLAAEQCAFGFEITRDVQEALDGLKHVLEAQLSAALAWKDAHKVQSAVAV